MRNRWLVNLLLLILVTALVALMRRELDQEGRVAVLTDLLPESITEIRIERGDEQAIHLIQRVEGWYMEEPYRQPADAGRIGELVGIAATGVHRSLPGGTDAGRLGVRSDGLRLTLNGLVLRFGDVDPIAQHRYVAIGDQVHLIGDGYHHHLIESAEAFIDRKLLPSDFQAGSGNLDGAPLTGDQLADLAGLTADSIEPLGSVLTGQLLSLSSEDSNRSLRFLVSADGRRWARIDLRLRYLLATAPAWAVAATTTEAGDPAE